MTPTATSAHKALLRHLNEALNSGDLDLVEQTIDEVFHPDVHIRTPLRIDATGAALMKQVWSTLLQAFPDLHVEIEDLVAEGDRVVARNTVTGTHRGAYLGLPAAQRRITWSEIFIGRLRDGRVVETWGVVDVAAQMRQLGLLPA